MCRAQPTISCPEPLSTRGLTLHALTPQMISAVANLAQLNANGKMNEQDRATLVKYLQRVNDTGKLAGCVISNSQRQLIACGCLESWTVFDGSTSYEMFSVHVHPEYRRIGLGKTVVETLIAYAQAHNGGQILLSVLNPHARALYVQYGFEDSGCRGMYTNAEMMVLEVTSVPLSNPFRRGRLSDLSYAPIARAVA